MTQELRAVRDGEQLEWMFFSAIRRINRSMDTHSKELERQFGLTLPQLDVLLAVDAHESLPIGQIAEMVHLSKPTLTSITERLVSHGLLVRERSETDKRQVRVSVTPKAQAILNQGPRPFHKLFSNRLRQLPGWQQTHMLSALQHLASLVEKPDEELPAIE